MTVLLLWHYVLTFDKEVTFFWGRVFSGPSALFFANRYLTLAVALYDAPLWSYSTVYAVSSAKSSSNLMSLTQRSCTEVSKHTPCPDTIVPRSSVYEQMRSGHSPALCARDPAVRHLGR